MPRAKKLSEKNEIAIGHRYMRGDKPKDIGPDFGLTANQISELARRRKWVQQKATINQKIEQSVLSDLDEISSLCSGLIRDSLKEYIEARKNGTLGLTVQDGEGFINKLAELTIKAGLATYGEKHKHANKLELAKLGQPTPQPGEAAGINVSPDV